MIVPYPGPRGWRAAEGEGSSLCRCQELPPPQTNTGRSLHVQPRGSSSKDLTWVRSNEADLPSPMAAIQAPLSQIFDPHPTSMT